MATDFFSLSFDDQRNVILAIANQKGLDASVIEKDIWLCWVLEKLFQLPLPMSFKGGTSLSKVYNLIYRFSEDIDITIDYHHFFPELTLGSGVSKSALKKLSEKLKENLANAVHQMILPHLQKAVKESFPDREIEVKASEDGEEIKIYYHSVLIRSEYLRDHILLEFGGRNSIEPHEEHKVKAIGHDLSAELTFPTAKIAVLSPIRTFWEKATLIHVECNRGRLADSPERLSRHWYDLFMLSRSPFKQVALANLALLMDVLVHKEAFFNASYAHYENCTNGNFRLVPEEKDLVGLLADYKKMISAGMFATTPPSMDEILIELKELEDNINS